MKETEEYKLGYADGMEAAQRLQEETIDWDLFRAEAAKDILAGIATRPELYINEKDRCKAAVSDAVALADELVKQLRKDEKGGNTGAD